MSVRSPEGSGGEMAIVNGPFTPAVIYRYSEINFFLNLFSLEPRETPCTQLRNISRLHVLLDTRTKEMNDVNHRGHGVPNHSFRKRRIFSQHLQLAQEFCKEMEVTTFEAEIH
jgi:hypothetical protein